MRESYQGQGRGAGRGRGRRTGRQGRGFSNRNKRNSYNNNNYNNNTSTLKFFPHSAGKQQSVTYDSVKEHIIKQVQKTFTYGQDIATTLNDLQLIDLGQYKPTKMISQETDSDLKKIEQEENDMIYHEEVKEFVKRKNALNINLGKAYAFIITYCNRTIEQRILVHPDYQTKIKNDPIELLKVIKILMHDPERAKYPYSSLTKAMARIINIKQYDKENLLDYSKRFKQAKDIFVSHVGSDILDKFSEHLPEYKTAPNQTARDELKKNSFNKWMACLIIENSDQSKYGTLNSNLSSQFSMKVNQYPDTITEAIDILNNHRFDNTKKGGRNGNGNGNDNTNNNRNQQERNESNDNVSTITEASFQQGNFGEGKCFCCGKKGHYSNQCRYKDKPKSEWAFAKAAQNFAASNDEQSTNTNNTDDRSVSSEWSGLHISMNNSELKGEDLMKNSIILDNGSTVDLFSNPELVHGIHQSEQIMELHTNAGSKINNRKATVPGYGKVWYDDQAIANIFGLGNMIKKHRVTFDSKKENAFLVHKKDGIIKFKASPEGLYYCTPSETLKRKVKK